MKNIELLAPAGSYEALVAAVQNGANAIYIGGSSFSARAYASNFNNEEILQAVQYTHLRNVKLFVAINILYKDAQFEELYNYLSFLYTTGIDAIIVQDIGLLQMAKEYFPLLEVHISTQASVKDIYGVNFYKQLGASRVVLARENTIDEIEYICKHSDIDIEVFIHGALCMGYSGQCLFSSFIAKRSGNQGTCGQPCRLSYKLTKDDKPLSSTPSHLLSPRDLCTIENIDKLIDAGIYSFKIEGRMKRPEYVATVIKAYRKAIDAHLSNKVTNNIDAIKEMKIMFNRGFTKGHLFNDKTFLADIYPGNKGMKIGSVVSYENKTRKLFIKLSQKLYQEDRILFREHDFVRTITKLYKQGKLVNHGNIGDIVSIDLDRQIKANTSIYRIYDHQIFKAAKATYENDNTNIPVSIYFGVNKDNFPILEITCGKIKIQEVATHQIEPAINASLNDERISGQLSKLGNTLYSSTKIKINFPDGYQFPIKLLNHMRRSCIEKLDIARLKNNLSTDPLSYSTLNFTNKQEPIDYVVKVRTIEQLQTVHKFGCKLIYFELNEYINEAVTYYQTNNLDMYVYTTYTNTNDDIQLLLNQQYRLLIKAVMVASYNGYQMLKTDYRIIIDSNFNIYNTRAIHSIDSQDIVLSRECSKTQINALSTNKTLYAYVYGYTPAMILKHCIISNHYYGKKVPGCNKCKQGKYALLDRVKSSFIVQGDKDCNNIIYNDRPLYYSKTKSLSITYPIIDFQLENAHQVSEVLNSYFRNKENIYVTNNKFTRGYFNE